MNTLPTPSEPVRPMPPGAPLTPAPAALAARMAGPRWRSDELLAGADEVLIAHGDAVYRLRRTGTGKLILTK